MLTLLSILAGLGLGSACLNSLIKSCGEKDNAVLKDFVAPALRGLEKGMTRKTGNAIEQLQHNVGSYLQNLPEGMKGDVEKVLHKGLGSLQDLFQQDRLADIGIDNDDAIIIITNDHVQPFQLSASMTRECQKIVAGKVSDTEKAQSIFQWFESNITYDHARAARNGSGYRNARQVFEDKQGICGEMAFLYIVMAWYVGITSACFVHVDRDHSGQDVQHACAGFHHNGRLVLVDPAYHTFDVKHQRYDIWDNPKTIQTFKAWNGKYRLKGGGGRLGVKIRFNLQHSRKWPPLFFSL